MAGTATASRGPGVEAPTSTTRKRKFRIIVDQLNTWTYGGVSVLNEATGKRETVGDKVFKRGTHIVDNIEIALAASRCRFGVRVEGLRREERASAAPTIPDFEDVEEEAVEEDPANQEIDA